MDKLKQALKELSTQEEIERMEELDLQREFGKKLESTEKSLDELKGGLVFLAKSSKESGNKISNSVKDNMGDFVDKLVEKLEEVKNTISDSVVKNKPINVAPVYKDMINQLSAIDKSIKDKPVPVWNWPQYASVGVRDTSFSNIDPSLAYQHNTTTPTTPYGTSLSFDSSGTIKVVSDTNKLPVDASVTIASSSLVGLEVKQSGGSVGDGTVNLTSAGTAQQISTSSVPCKRVVITAHESNTDSITVGASTVVGALAGRRGKTLFPTQSEVFFVDNLNLLYFDGITTGDDAHYYYEN